MYHILRGTYKADNVGNDIGCSNPNPEILFPISNSTLITSPRALCLRTSVLSDFSDMEDTNSVVPNNSDGISIPNTPTSLHNLSTPILSEVSYTGTSPRLHDCFTPIHINMVPDINESSPLFENSLSTKNVANWNNLNNLIFFANSNELVLHNQTPEILDISTPAISEIISMEGPQPLCQPFLYYCIFCIILSTYLYVCMRTPLSINGSRHDSNSTNTPYIQSIAGTPPTVGQIC